MDLAAARVAVRRLIQDGTSGDATYNVVRLEELSDQIPADATPTQRQFLLRFESVPFQEYVTVFAVPGSLAAYLDGSATPASPSADVDRNGNFTLPAPPTSKLQVTYAWQFFLDGDVDGFVDGARAWLRDFADVGTIPDGLTPALLHYAAGEACSALARKCQLANVRAGDAGADLAEIGKQYAAQAKDLRAAAVKERDDYYARAGVTRAPAMAATSLALDPYQPRQ